MSGVQVKGAASLVESVMARLQRFAAEAGQELKPADARRVATDLTAAGETADRDLVNAVKTRLGTPTGSTTQAGHDLDLERVSRMARDPNAPDPVDFPSGVEAARGTGAGFTHRDPGSQRLLPAPPGKDLVHVPDQPPRVTLTPDNPKLLPAYDGRPTGRGAKPDSLNENYADDLEAGLAFPKPDAPKFGTAGKVAAGATALTAGGVIAANMGDDAAPAPKSDDKADDTAPQGASAENEAAKDATKVIDPKTGFVPPTWAHANIAAFQKRLDAQKPIQPLPEEYGLDADNQKQAQADLDKRAADALAEHRAALNSIADDYRAAKSDLERRELWESLVQGIGYLVAGVWGMRTKTPINVKFAPSDWEARRRLALSERQVRAAEAGEQHKGEMAEVAQSRSDLERNWQRNAALFQSATNDHNRKTDELYRAWDAEVRDVNNRNQLTYQETMMKLQEAKAAEALAKATTDEEKRVAREQAEKAKQAGAVLRQMGQVMQTAQKGKEAERRAATGRLMMLNDQYRDITGEAYLPLDSVGVYEDTAWVGTEIEHKDIKQLQKDLAAHAASKTTTGQAANQPPAGKYPKTLRNAQGDTVDARNAAEEAEMRKAGFE